MPNVFVRECVLKMLVLDMGLMEASSALSGGSLINLATS